MPKRTYTQEQLALHAERQRGYRAKMDPEVRKAASRRHYQNRKSRVDHVDANLRHLYGITRAQRDALILHQDGLCAICKDPLVRPHTDHCHATGKVRGILCHHCNTGIGSLRESPRIFAAALDYLEKANG